MNIFLQYQVKVNRGGKQSQSTVKFGRVMKNVCFERLLFLSVSFFMLVDFLLSDSP